MYKKLKLYKIVPLVFLLLLLTACTQQEINDQQNVSSGTAESNKDVMQAENNSTRVIIQGELIWRGFITGKW